MLPEIRDNERLDVIIANGENAAGGFGITASTLSEILDAGVHVVTMGNHLWDRREIDDVIEHERLVRPLNYPPRTPGKGYLFYETSADKTIAVVNLMGRVYMNHLDCPFRRIGEELEEIGRKTKIILVDFHAEVTSEKVAMGWFLNGRVSAVVGTHTHVPTADERILPEGTAYISDVGMVGSQESVIGVRREIIIKKFITHRPVRFEIASEQVVLMGVIIDIDEQTGKALGIRRVVYPHRATFD